MVFKKYVSMANNGDCTGGTERCVQPLLTSRTSANQTGLDIVNGMCTAVLRAGDMHCPCLHAVNKVRNDVIKHATMLQCPKPPQLPHDALKRPST
jgi:hypothetical protein